MERKIVRRIASRAALITPFSWLKKMSAQPLIFPFYHVVSNSNLPYISNLYPIVSEKQFRNDLEFLLLYYTPATFSDVIQFVQSGRKPGKPSFFLTFDDGFAQCETVIAPVLKELGIEAAFFVNPAFIDNQVISHRQKISFILEKYAGANKTEKIAIAKITGVQTHNTKSNINSLKKLNAGNISIIDEIADVLKIDFGKLTTEFKPYLSLGALRKLHYEGFHIGSHGLDHKEFQLLQPSEMKQQIEEGFSWLETHLKIEKRIFSFPFTDHNISLSFFEYLQNEANVLLSFGTAGLKHDTASRHIQRIPAEMHGFNSLRQILKAEYLYYLAKKPVNKNLIVRK